MSLGILQIFKVHLKLYRDTQFENHCPQGLFTNYVTLILVISDRPTLPSHGIERLFSKTVYGLVRHAWLTPPPSEPDVICEQPLNKFYFLWRNGDHFNKLRRLLHFTFKHQKQLLLTCLLLHIDSTASSLKVIDLRRHHNLAKVSRPQDERQWIGEDFASIVWGAWLWEIYSGNVRNHY